jgi:hypothetical protein
MDDSDPRSDWTPLDYEHEDQLMEILRTQGWEAYCAIRNAEMERIFFLANVGPLQ